MFINPGGMVEVLSVGPVEEHGCYYACEADAAIDCPNGSSGGGHTFILNCLLTASAHRAERRPGLAQPQAARAPSAVCVAAAGTGPGAPGAWDASGANPYGDGCLGARERSRFSDIFPTDMSRSRVALTSPTPASRNAVQTCPEPGSAQPVAAFALVCGAHRWRQPMGDSGCLRMSGKFKSWPHRWHTCGLGSRHLSQSLCFLIYTSEGSGGVTL